MGRQPRQTVHETHRIKETTMFAVAYNAYRHLTAAAAAALITLVITMSFVQSTTLPARRPLADRHDRRADGYADLVRPAAPGHFGRLVH